MVDEHSNTAPVFLDTTVQIDRILGTQDRRNTISFNLRGRRAATSGHVLGEFNKTLLKDAVAFLELLGSSPNVSEAIKRLHHYGRQYPRTIDLLATLGLDDDKQKTMERLEKFIEWQAHDQFWEPIDRAVCTDEVGCVLKSWIPEPDESGSYDVSGLKCLKENPPSCAVQEFIEKNRPAIDDFVVAAKDSRRENVRRAGEALGKIIRGEDVPFGERSNCYSIADTMIVLESRSDAEVYSTDGDVASVCEIIGRRRYNESPLHSG